MFPAGDVIGHDNLDFAIQYGCQIYQNYLVSNSISESANTNSIVQLIPVHESDLATIATAVSLQDSLECYSLRLRQGFDSRRMRAH